MENCLNRQVSMIRKGHSTCSSGINSQVCD